MDEGVDFSLDLVVVILIIAMLSPFFFKSATFMLNPNFGGFDSKLQEKTAQYTTEELYPTKRVIDRDDIMLMLAVADKYTMSPIKYDINGFIFDVDDIYFNNRISVMVNSFAVMDTAPKKFTLYYGPSGPRKWVIENE